MTVTIRYPSEPMMTEKLESAVHGLDTVELRSHASFIPLGPGDIVTVDHDMNVTGVVELAPVYTYQVDFHLPADVPAFMTPTADHKAVRAVKEVLAEWDAHPATTGVTQETGFTAYVSSDSLVWLQKNVTTHKYVKYAELTRTPSLELRWEVAILHPDIVGAHEGPWA